MRSILTVVVLQLCATTTYAQERVAFPLPLTGPLAPLGSVLLKGQQAAVEALNKEGGLLGKKIEPHIYDTQCDPARAKSIANRLVNERISVAIGYACASELAAAAPTHRDGGTLVITPGAGAAQAHESVRVFRIAPPPSRQQLLLQQYLRQLKEQSIGVFALGEKGYYAQAAAGFVFSAKQESGQIAGPYKIDPLPAGVPFPSSYTSAVTVIFAPSGAAERVIKDMRDRKLRTVPVLTGVYDASVTAPTLSPAWRDALIVGLADPSKEKFAARAAGNLKAAGVGDRVAAYYAYASVEVWAAAVRVTKTLDPEKLDRALRRLRFETAVGSVSFDKDGYARETHYGFFQVGKGGKAIAITAYGGRPPPPPPPPPN